MAVIKRPKPVLVIIIFAIILLLIGGVWIYLASPVNSKDTSYKEVEITSGTGVSKISSILKDEKLIKSKNLFKIYYKLYGNKTLKAGTYKLSPSMNLESIVRTLEEGSKFDNSLKMTFKEGTRITDYAKVISDNTNYSYDEVINVFKDIEYAKELISKYWFLTDDILNTDIYYPLEGYLAPDTYYFNKDDSIQKIIEVMLDEEENKLSKYKDIMGDKVHSYLTMASITELEGKKLDDRKNIVGVFNNRINIGISLGSDVTTYYAFQVPMTEKLTSAQYNTINPYNTRPTSKAGLPVGPICNPSLDSIEAAVNPIDNEYLYFVADSEGVVYFSKTSSEQDKVISDLRKSGKWNA